MTKKKPTKVVKKKLSKKERAKKFNSSKINKDLDLFLEGLESIFEMKKR